MAESVTEETRVQRFARAVCNAWYDNDCVMNNQNKVKCSKKNCFVYPIAVETLAKLDVRGISKEMEK